MTGHPMKLDERGVEVVDTSDAAWAIYRAEGEAQLAKSEAALAESTHQLDMIRAAGIAAINSVRDDPQVLADARVLHNQDPAGPSVDAIIEMAVIPIREKYLAQFSSDAPVTVHKIGLNEAAFLKLLGGK